jgi:hypothetical protein
MNKFEIHIEGQDPYIIETEAYDPTEVDGLIPANVEFTYRKIN